MTQHRQTPASKFTVTIESLNADGAGVAQHKQHKVMIEKTLPGEVVEMSYHPERPRKSRIRLKRILTPSPERVAAPCEYFDRCCGCHLQHMDYGQQLQFKQSVIENLVRENDVLSGIAVHPVTGMPEPFHYRNKAQLPFYDYNGEATFGLFRSGTHELIPVNHCPVESREANIALGIVRDWARDFRIPIYDESTHSGLLRHVAVRKSVFTKETMVVLVTTSRDIPHIADLLRALKTGLSGLRSVQINLNTADTNTILGDENILAWGENYITERLGKWRFRVYPNTFFQVNTVQMLKMLERLKTELLLNSEDRVFDLYCGVGAIALSVAEQVREVIGIESNAEAIAAAEENARDNRLPNLQFICGDAADAMATQLAAGHAPDVVIADPPRKGLPESLIEQIATANPRSVAYFSCNPKTLVRDLAIFRQNGYAATDIFPFDMFPQTYHVECLTVLQKSK